MLKETEELCRNQAFKMLYNASSLEGEQHLVSASTDHLQKAFISIAKYYKIDVVIDKVALNSAWQKARTVAEKQKMISCQIENLADLSGIPIRRVLLKDDWFKKNNEPLIAFVKETLEPVVLLPKGELGYEVDFLGNTAGEDRQRTVDDVVAGCLSEHAYQAYKPLPSRALKIKDIWQYFLQSLHVKDVIAFSAAGIIFGLLGLLLPIIMGKIFSQAIPQNDRYQLLIFILVLLFAAALKFCLSNMQGFALLNIETRVEKALHTAVWHRVLHLPTIFFREFTSGDLAQRSNAVNAIRATLSGVLTSSFMPSVFSGFSLALLFYYSVKLALVAVVSVVVSSIVLVVGSYYNLKYQKRYLALSGKMSGFLVQCFFGVGKIRSLAAENRMFFLWAQNYAEQIANNIKAGKATVFVNATLSGIPAMTTALIFWLFVKDLDTHTMSIADFIAFNTAFAGFFYSMTSIASSVISMLNIVPLYERALPIIRSNVERKVGAHIITLDGSISLEDVSFRYDKEEHNFVLKNVSLKANPGEFIAIVGTSGSGKSTILRMLLGFEKPEHGMVLYNANDLQGLDIQTVRRQCGVVLQNSRLLPENIINNVTGISSLTEEEVWTALELTGLKDDVLKMPLGLHTQVGEQGSALSGGQRQRLLIARAIIKKPKIIILDEATSALDSSTQSFVMDELAKMEATRIVIAHRLATIINADRVYVLHEGAVVESGTYNELINQGGFFAQMVQRQLV